MGYTRLVDLIFQPSALPLYLPRFVMLTLVVLLGILVVGEILPRVRTPTRRRARGLAWWRLMGAPRPVPFRWTYIIGPDGNVLHVDREVNPSTAGADLVTHLADLGVAKR